MVEGVGEVGGEGAETSVLRFGEGGEEGEGAGLRG